MVPPTDPSLLPILEELRALEPIFHTAAFGLTQADRERRTAPGYWEVGASGHRYTRDFILNLDPTHFVDAETSGWRTSSHAVQRLGPDTWLFTYTLKQEARLTRRATIWQSTPSGWQILYHQGTLAPSAAH
jgi:hypothetical protein